MYLLPTDEDIARLYCFIDPETRFLLATQEAINELTKDSMPYFDEIEDDIVNMQRGYRTMDSVWNKIYCTRETDYGEIEILPLKDLFPSWHNNRYLIQCYHNLEEKYDCGGITEESFKKISEVYFKEKSYV